MKRIIIVLLFVSTFTISKSQNHSAISLGGGYPFFFQSNFNKESGGTHSISNKKINAFIEKPGLFKLNSESLYITPGVGYFLFNENGSGGGLGGGNSKTLKHQAVSLYGKFIYEWNFKSVKSTNLYLGFVSGLYLYSNTTGTKSWWQMYQNNNRSGTTEVDRSGNHFFNSAYMGFIFGIKPLGNNSSSLFVPTVELSFMPNYAVIYDDHIVEDEQKLTKSMLMLSLSIGFNPKRKKVD